MLSRPVAAVVFDMDGLLFDTESLYEKALFTAAAEIGCEMDADSFQAMVGTPWPDTRRRLLGRYGAGYPADRLVEIWVAHFKLLADRELTLKPGALELLTWLDELALPRAIATSSSHATVRHHLAAHGLGDRFHAIVAEGDYAMGKPAPEPFLRVAERLGVDPRDCLALEDSPNGVRSAAAAGMMTVMVPDRVRPTQEIARLCLILASLHEVVALISSSRPASAAASS
ncbi:MAG: HAD family phosphatase [Enhydrobacter sp.]|nr:MAG: HAD family phosphatase [Enhydrobacter sp.]